MLQWLDVTASQIYLSLFGTCLSRLLRRVYFKICCCGGRNSSGQTAAAAASAAADEDAGSSNREDGVRSSRRPQEGVMSSEANYQCQWSSMKQRSVECQHCARDQMQCQRTNGASHGGRGGARQQARVKGGKTDADGIRVPVWIVLSLLLLYVAFGALLFSITRGAVYEQSRRGNFSVFLHIIINLLPSISTDCIQTT